MQPIKLGIMDKSQFVHDSLNDFCNRPENSFCVEINALTYEDLLTKMSEKDIDVLVADIDYPFQGNDLETLKKIHQIHPDTRILIFSSCEHENMVSCLFKSGVKSYVKKIESKETLFRAIQELDRKGYEYIYDMSSILSGGSAKRPGVKKVFIPYFSKKEIMIADLTRKEFTAKETAAKMNMSEKNVERIKLELCVKTDSKRMYGVIDYLVRHGIL